MCGNIAIISEFIPHSGEASSILSSALLINEDLNVPTMLEVHDSSTRNG